MGESTYQALILICVGLVFFIIIWLSINEELIHDIKREILYGDSTFLDYVKFIILNVSFTIIFIMIVIKSLEYVQLI